MGKNFITVDVSGDDLNTSGDGMDQFQININQISSLRYYKKNLYGSNQDNHGESVLAVRIDFSDAHQQSIYFAGDDLVRRINQAIGQFSEKIQFAKTSVSVNASPEPENLVRVRELAGNRNLNNPFNENELRQFSLEELELYRSELFERVKAYITPLRKYLRNFSSLDVPLKERFYVAVDDDGLVIKFDDEYVYSEGYHTLVLGEWLNLIFEYHEQLKQKSNHDADISLMNQRDELISQMIGKSSGDDEATPF